MKALSACTWVLCSLLCAGSAQANDEGYLKEGMKASAVRKLILKHEWQPNLSKSTRESPMWGQQARLYQRGYTEVDRCAVDRSVCILKYKKQQACLEVEIEGERVSQMRVIGWTRECLLDR